MAAPKKSVAKESGQDKAGSPPEFSREQELKALRDMLLIRRFEEKAGQLYGMGFIGGFCHLYIGQEAVAVGLQSALKEGHDSVITGYRAVIDPEALGKMLTAFISLRTLNPVEDDEVPVKLVELPEIVSCYSVAGRESHLLVVQVGSPSELERLLSEIRQRAGVSTETTLVLSVPYADRPPL